VERMPHGRHSAAPAPPPGAGARSGIAAKSRSVWITTLGLAFALVAALFTLGLRHGPAALPASSSTPVPLFGASVGSLTSLGQTKAVFGALPIVRVYYPGLPASNAWTGGDAGANDSAVIVSFKALPTDILSGKDDAPLKHFFDTAPTGHPVYYSYYHEPEDNIADGQFTAADYKAAWAHVAALADAAHNPDLHSTLILMSWDLVKASGRNWKDYLPGKGIISTLGWDAYPVGSATNVNPQPTPPAEFMGPCIAASNSVGLPYGFAEFGLSTATGRPAWMTGVGNYLMTSGALFATVFNGSPQYPTLQLTDPASQKVWKGFVAQSGSNQPAPPAPAPTPTSPSPTGSPGPDPTPTATPTAPGSPDPTPTGTPTAPVSPAPTPTTTGTPPPAPGPADGNWVSGLNLRPARFAAGGSNHTVVNFRIGQAASVAVLILRSDGTIARQITKPSHAAGQLWVPYYGYNGGGSRLPAGRYTVLVVASNASVSASAAATLTIGAP
jgi:hypothetical protein